MAMRLSTPRVRIWLMVRLDHHGSLVTRPRMPRNLICQEKDVEKHEDLEADVAPEPPETRRKL